MVHMQVSASAVTSRRPLRREMEWASCSCPKLQACPAGAVATVHEPFCWRKAQKQAQGSRGLQGRCRMSLNTIWFRKASGASPFMFVSIDELDRLLQSEVPQSLDHLNLKASQLIETPPGVCTAMWPHAMQTGVASSFCVCGWDALNIGKDN